MDVRGDVVGQAAGRDIHNHGPVVQIAVSPLAESELQARFHKNTGMWCPRTAREIFEALMERHDFSAKELRQAWGKSVEWDAESRALVFKLPIVEAVLAWSMLIIVTLQCLLLGMETAVRPPLFFWSYPVAMSVLSGYWLLAVFMFRTIMRPRRIAQRIRALVTDSDAVEIQAA